MGKSTISMAIFNSYFDITRGYHHLSVRGLDKNRSTKTRRNHWIHLDTPWGILIPTQLLPMVSGTQPGRHQSMSDLYSQYKDSNSNYGWSELKTEKSPWSKGKSCIIIYYKYMEKVRKSLKLSFCNQIFSASFEFIFQPHPLWINLQLPCWWPWHRVFLSRVAAGDWLMKMWMNLILRRGAWSNDLVLSEKDILKRIFCLGIQWIHNGVIWCGCIINRLFDMYFTCSVYRIVCLYSFG